MRVAIDEKEALKMALVIVLILFCIPVIIGLVALTGMVVSNLFSKDREIPGLDLSRMKALPH
jgi:hypothetical protein